MEAESVILKTCRKCGAQKSVSEFHRHKTGRDGYAAQCKDCRCDHQRVGSGLQRRQERTQKFIDSGASKFYKRVQRLVRKGLPKDDAIFAAQQPIVVPSESERIEKQYDILAERNARQAWSFFIKNKASDAWVARYFECAGTPWLNRRLSEKARWAIKYEFSDEFRIQQRVRARVRKVTKHMAIADRMRQALNAKQNRENNLEVVLGFSIAELRNHMERQFTRGMTWEKFKGGEIHIDHIIPISAFNIRELGDEEWRSCWCLSNLRPAWAEANLKKSNKIFYLL